MTDATTALYATTFYVISTTTGIPDIVEQSIAIFVLITVVGYLLTRQERFNQEFIKSLRSNSEAINALASAIAELTKSCDKSQEDNEKTIEILLNQLTNERKTGKE